MPNLQGLGFWLPSSENDIRRAIDNKLLAESHHLDVKKALGPANDEVNDELARDLASFAIDGGALIFGIHEPRPGVFIAQPMDTGGLGERIEQVALMRLEPPLFVRTYPIQADGSPDGHGYLVVHIPPSVDAPHMVGGRYWGRNDKTKYVLPDDQVERHIRARSRSADSVEPALSELADRAGEFRTTLDGIYLFAAEPVRAQTGIALRYTYESGWQNALRKLVSESLDSSISVVPDLRWASHAVRRPGGVALTPSSGKSVAAATWQDGNFIEITVLEDGGLRLLSSNATMQYHNGERLDPPLIFDDLIYAHTRHMLVITTRFAEDLGYGGPWDLGVEVDGLRNGISHRLGKRDFPHGAATYSRTTRAYSIEIVEATPRITGRLIGALLRSLGSAAYYDLG